MTGDEKITTTNQKRSSAEILTDFNKYRRGYDSVIHKASDIGLAIDDAIAALKERDIARMAAIKMAGEIARFRSVYEKESRLVK